MDLEEIVGVRMLQGRGSPIGVVDLSPWVRSPLLSLFHVHRFTKLS